MSRAAGHRLSGAAGMARGRRGRRSSKVDAQRRVFHFAPPGAQLWAQHPKRDERVVGALLSRCGEGRLGVSQGSSELGGDPPDMAPTHRQRAAHLEMPLRDPILRAPKTQTSCLRHGVVTDVVSERPLNSCQESWYLGTIDLHVDHPPLSSLAKLEVSSDGRCRENTFVRVIVGFIRTASPSMQWQNSVRRKCAKGDLLSACRLVEPLGCSSST